MSSFPYQRSGTPCREVSPQTVRKNKGQESQECQERENPDARMGGGSMEEEVDDDRQAEADAHAFPFAAEPCGEEGGVEDQESPRSEGSHFPGCPRDPDEEGRRVDNRREHVSDGNEDSEAHNFILDDLAKILKNIEQSTMGTDSAAH